MAEEIKEIATLQDGAKLVEKYATRLISSERAQQFSTQISVMVQRQPLFKDADPLSIVTAMMACVGMDLMPNTPEQQAYLIPYKVSRPTDEKDEQGKTIWKKVVEVQFQLGYKGLVTLMYRSGQVTSVNAELVFEGDIFNVTLGSDRKLVHKPSFDVDRTNYSKVTHAYATVKLTNGETIFDVMTRKELDKIQESAKAKSTDSPWTTWPEAMAKKTVVKRITKLLPTSNVDDRLQYAAQVDSWAQAGRLKFKDGEIIEGDIIAAEESSKERQARMAAAEAKHKQLNSKNFTPKAVENEGN